MRTTTRLCLVLAVVATAGLVVAVPAVTAKSQTAKEKRIVKKQNAAIKKVGDRVDKAADRLDNLRDLALALGAKNDAQDIKDLDQDAADQKLTDDIAATNATIAALTPVVTNALTALQAGLTQVGAGLTTVGAGLTTLGAAYQSVEYGVAKVFANNATVAAGGSITSADIPDDGNAAVANGTAVLVATGSPVTLDLRADIRSNEGDNGAGATVGQAGGFVYVRNTSQTFTDDDADVDPGGGVVAENRDAAEVVSQRANCIGAPTPPGILGTVAGDSIVTPSGTVTNLPIRNLPGGVARTDTVKPEATSVNLLNAASCNFVATPGQVYEVYYSVNFVDVPTSTTPGGTE